MPFVQSDSTKIYYEVQGGEGEPLILISGFGATHVVWRFLIPLLKNHFTLITLDNRGVGKSDSPDADYTMQEHANDVRAVMKHLQLSKAHILGHSMGTKIAIMLAALYPECVDKLILMSGKSVATSKSSILNRLNGLLIQANLAPDVINEVTACWLYANDFMNNETEFKKILAISAEQGKTFSISGRKGQVAANQADLSSVLPDIKAKTLAIAGDEDILIFPKQTKALADSIADSEFVMIENCGHLPQIEKPKELAGIITEFLLPG